MVSAFVKNILLRLVLPVALFAAAIIRPSAVSLVFGILGLLSPIVSSYTAHLSPRFTNVYIIITFGYATLVTIGQIVAQSLLGFTVSNADYMKNCNITDPINDRFEVFRQFGWFKFSQDFTGNWVRTFLPEPIAFVASMITVVLCVILKTGVPTIEQSTDQEEETEFNSPRAPDDSPEHRPTSPESTHAPTLRESICPWFKRVSEYVVVILMVLVGTIWPSLLALVYFISFLLVITWWALYKPLRRNHFNFIKLVLITYSALHLIVLYLYQLKFFQDLAPPSGLAARLIGLTAIIHSTCPNVWHLEFVSYLATQWPVWANPALLLSFYFFLAYQYQWTKSGTSITGRHSALSADGSSVHEELGILSSGSGLSRGRAPTPERQVLLGHEEQDEDVFKAGTKQKSPAATQNGADGAPQQRTASEGTMPVFGESRIRLFSESHNVIGKTIGQATTTTINFVIFHCYAFGLITMMLWAIFYHSWLSFVFLLAACAIWAVPDTRKVALNTSPIVVAYAEILLCIQYVYSFNLNVSELPTGYIKDGSDQIDHEYWYFPQLGFHRYSTPCLVLWLKIVLALPFFLTMRLFLRERYYAKNPAAVDGQQSYGTFPGRSISVVGGDTAPSLGGSFIGGLFARYWIFVVSLVLLLVAVLGSKVHMYNVGYMILFGLLVVLMQVSFSAFRRSLWVYWSVVTMYSMVVLVALYLYQFSEVPSWWKNTTGLSEELNTDIGLVDYHGGGELLLHLLGPIAFLFVAILQLKFFHRTWMRLTDLRIARETAYERQTSAGRASKFGGADESLPLMKRLQNFFEKVVDFVFLVAEVHFGKLIALSFILLAVCDVSALNFALVCVVSLLLPFPRLRWIAAFIGTIYLVLVAIAKMIFQMSFVDATTLGFVPDAECIEKLGRGNSTQNFSDTTEWAGFRKVNDVSTYLAGYIITLVVLAFNVIILARQKYKRTENGVPTDPPSVLFPEIHRENADDGLINCMKFFVNYFFYKFGLEMCFSLTMLVVSVRMDAFALIYLLVLFVLLLQPRHVLAKIWWIYTTILAILLPLQYALCVGFPPQSCIRYPFSNILGVSDPNNLTSYEAKQNKNLIMWLFLPDYVSSYAPKPEFLVADFFQLLFACCQMAVFRREIKYQPGEYPGGDNSPIIKGDHVTTEQENPVKDFVETKTDTTVSIMQRSQLSRGDVEEDISFLDMIKYGLFMYGHWVTLIMVFVAGLGGKSLFSLGYLIFAFVFLWKGNDLYLKPMGTVLRKWKMLVFYNVVIVGCKVALQFVGCVYPHTFSSGSGSSDRYCFVAQLFSIACLNDRLKFSPTGCVVNPHEAGVGYDLACFIFLMAQLRILSSWYFQHCVLEYKVQRILSSRGAVLINDLVKRQMRKQQQAEEDAFASIAERADKIRRKQKKGTFVAKTYADSKRAADKTWFDYPPEDDDDLELNVTSGVPEATPGAEDSGGLDPTQIVHTAIQRDLDATKTLKGLEAAEHVPEDQRGLAALSVEKTQSDDDEITPAPPPPFADDESVTESKTQESEGIGNKIIGWIKLIGQFLGSVLHKIAALANTQSRDYRYVAYVLKVEKQRLKDRMRPELSAPTLSIRDVRRELRANEIGKEIKAVKSERDIERLEVETQEKWRQQNVFARLFAAISYLFVSHTEILCYLLMILDHMATATLLSLPLPLIAFFWGTLCSPRPPKMFWIVAIGYTEAIMVVKFIFQFNFYAFNNDMSNDNDPFYGPRIIGVMHRDKFAAWDVALLIVLFFHRYMLRTLGLWKDARHTVMGETDTGEKKQVDIVSDNKNEDYQSSTSSVTKQSPTGSVDGSATTATTKSKTKKSTPFLAYCGGFGKFFDRLFHPTVRYIADMYPYMFFMDVICFVISTFGYAAFGSEVGDEGNVVAVIQSNRVPIQFVVLMIVLVLLMVIDRALYLGKSLKAKLAFQYLLVLGVHGWIFFLLPHLTGRLTMENGVAQLWYFVKGVYFLVSAWQIRNGYPRSSIGHLLMKSYSIVSFVLFKIFMGIPFLFELRTLIDWTWTDTSMPLFDYFNMENYFATIFGLKCSRKMEQDFPAPRGEKKGSVVKYAMGLPLVLLLIIIVFGPLLAYSMVNLIGTRLPPDSASLTVQLEGYPAIFHTELQDFSETSKLSTVDLNQIKSMFSDSRSAGAFIKDYTNDNVLKIEFAPSSMTYWTLTHPADDELKREIARKNDSGQTLQLAVILKLRRPRVEASKEPTYQSLELHFDLDPMSFHDAYWKQTELHIRDALPYYIIQPSAGEVLAADKLNGVISQAEVKAAQESKEATTAKGLINMVLQFKNETRNDSTTGHYWSVDFKAPQVVHKYLLNEPVSEFPPTFVIFVDKVFPSFLSAIVSGGIIAMYVAVVLVVGRLIRGVFTNIPLDVIINEMPNVDRLLRLCRDMYLVREAGDFELEQDLFARIIFLFRSPETLLKWSRPVVRDD